MATIFAKMSTSGLKIGGRVAARQMSKHAAKEAAKQTAEKTIKHATKKGVKSATKQNEKIVQTYKNKTPSFSKKDKKNLTQAGLEKTKKRQEEIKMDSKQLELNENFNCLSSTEDDITSMISPPFVTKSNKIQPKPDFRCHSVLNDGSDLKTKSTHKHTLTRRSSTVPLVHFKDTSMTSDNKFSETNELKPVITCQKSPDKTFDFHGKVLEKGATEESTLPIRQPKNLKLLANSSCNPQIPIDCQRLELLKGEALKEIEDIEFNLMLLRLAKYLLVDTEEAKDFSRKGHNKGNKGCQWLEALRLVLNSDAFR